MTEPHNPYACSKAIIARWPSRAELARDVGVTSYAVHNWARRRIPGGYDLALLEAAHRRGIPLTLEELAHARAARPKADGSSLAAE